MTPGERRAWLEVNPLAAVSLREAVGLSRVDTDDELHGELVDAIAALPPGATLGQRIIALRLVFNWAHVDAGRTYATAKADYEHFMAKRKAALMLADGHSGVKAAAIAEGDDEAYGYKLKYLLAEQRERSMRQFLQTLEAALDNHRTDRADWRGQDAAHAAGLTGGA